MRSIERRFDGFQLKRPEHSSLLNFATAVNGQRFSKSAVHRWFYKLVDPDDYVTPEKRQVLKWLDDLSAKKPRV